MRFSLQDIQKRVQRRGGELFVTLHLLRPGESREEIARLIAYHEQLLSQPQRAFSIDDARAFAGDYRLAHCLIATLGAWYSWRSPDWDAVLRRLDNSAPGEAGIASSAQLRLALFDYVNAHHAGFLSTQMRAQVLQQFATRYGLTPADLEYLLLLDSDDEAMLSREGFDRPPTPDEVATLYNQWAFEAALFNASEVHFVIDCNAFLAQSKAGKSGASPATGVGAVIKRLCFLARKLGVYYDLAYTSATDQADATHLHLTLYGPQDMSGAPQHYGARLSRLCRLLLGYSKKGNLAPTISTAAIVQAYATVHFLQRAYRFVMDANLLKLLPAQNMEHEGIAGADTVQDVPTTNAVYDSSIEQAFAEAFLSLARSDAADGWQLEREPEPLLLTMQGSSMQSIFIPDFALTRDRHRLYLEILGFWTPSYRERKLQKLQQLKAREDIVLAIPIEARGAFASLASDFPIVEYDGQLSASEVVQVVRAHVDDFAERVALVEVAQVRARVSQAGLLPERACFAALHCYRRTELALAAEHIVGDGIDFAPGVGLYTRPWLEALGPLMVDWLAGREQQQAPLAEALQALRSRWPVLNGCNDSEDAGHVEDSTLEAIMGLLTPLQIRRRSIFDAVIGLDGFAEQGTAEPALQADGAAPRKIVRERRATYKKRPAELPDIQVSQQDLWG